MSKNDVQWYGARVVEERYAVPLLSAEGIVLRINEIGRLFSTEARDWEFRNG